MKTYTVKSQGYKIYVIFLSNCWRISVPYISLASIGFCNGTVAIFSFSNIIFTKSQVSYVGPRHTGLNLTRGHSSIFTYQNTFLDYHHHRKSEEKIYDKYNSLNILEGEGVLSERKDASCQSFFSESSEQMLAAPYKIRGGCNLLRYLTIRQLPNLYINAVARHFQVYPLGQMCTPLKSCTFWLVNHTLYAWVFNDILIASLFFNVRYTPISEVLEVGAVAQIFNLQLIITHF